MYLRDDELDAHTRSELDNHTSSCRACAADYARVVSARKVIGGLKESLPQLDEKLILINSVIGRIELESGEKASHNTVSAFDRCVLWLSSPLVRAAAAAMLLLITGACAFESISAIATMKSYEQKIESLSAREERVAAAGTMNQDRLLNAAADLAKMISANQSYVGISDKWVMINKQSLEELFLLYNELKENTPQLPTEFRTTNPELTKILETKQPSAQMRILLKEREQLIRELNTLLKSERRKP
jgi:hypothetical protein